MQAFAFTGFTAADAARFGANGFFSRFCSGGPCNLEAALLLPAGARVDGMELEACDTDPTAGVFATFVARPLLEGLATFRGLGTGNAETPGCDLFPLTFVTPEVIDNYNKTVEINGTTAATRFAAVRVFYTLQVSPAPAMATFNDVPTGHAFFRFIEALAASGITTGCNASPPLYCPDDPVTRGQMAVFISKALGLHFPH